jgi:hypothetical protein
MALCLIIETTLPSTLCNLIYFCGTARLTVYMIWKLLYVCIYIYVRARGPGFDSRRYQIFCEVVGLERGPLSLVRIIE